MRKSSSYFMLIILMKIHIEHHNIRTKSLELIMSNWSRNLNLFILNKSYFARYLFIHYNMYVTSLIQREQFVLRIEQIKPKDIRMLNPVLEMLERLSSLSTQCSKDLVVQTPMLKELGEKSTRCSKSLTCWASKNT